MPTYRHKALKLTAKLAVGYIDMYLIREDDNKISRMFGDTILPLEYIIHFGFEEVKEEKQEDWIDKAFDEIDGTYDTKEEVRESFRQAIEKHMPQQKFTIGEVNAYVEKIGYEECLFDFLRDHGLLEE